MEGDIEVYIVYLCQFSDCYLNSQYSFLGDYYNIFFFMFKTLFFLGPKARNVRIYHAVTATICVTANHPVGLTLGHSLWKLNP